MSSLKPCPFCECRAGIFKVLDDYIFVPIDYDLNQENRYSIKCASCFCGTGIYKDIHRAIEAWNRRADNERTKAD